MNDSVSSPGFDVAEFKLRQDLVNVIYRALDSGMNADEVCQILEAAKKPTELLDLVFRAWRQ